ncbi:MAG: serine/threonine protein kinase [Planctomycetaceae bacterium]|nr:serine/threonine protein kinase [Planctomycetaceae bacterium]
MTTPRPDDEPTSAELELLEWLDKYDDALARGETIEFPSDLAKKFDKLPRWVQCLERLGSLAIPQTIDSGAPGSSSRSSSSLTQLPRDFGAYELLEELGRGGMGVVYLGRHRKLDTHFAVKMIRTSEFASEEEIRRFFQEAQAASRLKHPNIVSVHDAGELDGLPFLVMQYIRGETLSERTKREPLDLDGAVRILIPVARAVDYLHSQGIIHRDVKPANVLIDDDGVPHVTDFGLAKVFNVNQEQTATGTVIGTPAYMAPEQAWGKTNTVCAANDIYSLGAILYELIVGQTPFPESNPLDQILRLRDSEPRPPRRVNPLVPIELEQICLRCLEKQPGLRYETAKDLADDLERFLHSEPITLKPIGVWQRIRRWVRREPALVSHLAGFLTMAIIIEIRQILASQPRASFYPVMVILLTWSLLATAMQKLLIRGKLWVRYVWVAMDAVLFTVALNFAQPPIESLLLGYPMLIAACSLWYEPTVVLVMTIASVVSYLTLFTLRGDSQTPVHYPFIVTGMLLVVGGITFGLIRRIRKLLDLQANG